MLPTIHQHRWIREVAKLSWAAFELVVTHSRRTPLTIPPSRKGARTSPFVLTQCYLLTASFAEFCFLNFSNSFDNLCLIYFLYQSVFLTSANCRLRFVWHILLDHWASGCQASGIPRNRSLILNFAFGFELQNPKFGLKSIDCKFI